MRFAFRDVVEAPPSTVFKLIADVERKHEWVAEVISSRRTGDGTPGVGATFEDTVRFMGRTSVIPTVFIAYEPHRKIAYRHLGGPIRADLSYVMAPVKDGTELTVSIDAGLPWYLAPLTPLMRRGMARQMSGNFAALKGLLDITGATH